MLLTMKKRKNNIKSGSGYYLALDSCPPGGLSTVKGYDDCCPPMFSGSLSGISSSTNWDPNCNNSVQIGTSRRKQKSRKLKKKNFTKKRNTNRNRNRNRNRKRKSYKKTK